MRITEQALRQIICEELSKPVVYHGSNTKFDQFKPSTRLKLNYGEGIYFTEDESNAVTHATRMAADFGGSPYVAKVTLNIKNPFRPDTSYNIEFARKLVNDPNKWGPPRWWQEDKSDYESPKEIYGKNVYNVLKDNNHSGDSQTANQQLQNAGFDGIVFIDRDSERNVNKWVAFAPEQVNIVEWIEVKGQRPRKDY